MKKKLAILSLLAASARSRRRNEVQRLGEVSRGHSSWIHSWPL
jgi:hypothetical protein